MKYEVTFTGSIRDEEGYTRSMWSAVQHIEVDHLSGLIPLLTSIEKVVEDWRETRLGESVNEQYANELLGIPTRLLRQEFYRRKAAGYPGTEE